MALESALIPIPSEVTMPFSGFLVTMGRFSFWLIVIVGALGNLAGSLAAYYLGLFGEEKVREVIRKWGKFALISEREYDHAEKWFKKHGEIIVFISRLLPVIRTFISLPAGISRMNLKKFILYTILGSLIWSAILTYIGVVLGSNWLNIGGLFHKFDILISISLAVVIIWYFQRKLRHIRHP